MYGHVYKGPNRCFFKVQEYTNSFSPQFPSVCSLLNVWEKRAPNSLRHVAEFLAKPHTQLSPCTAPPTAPSIMRPAPKPKPEDIASYTLSRYLTDNRKQEAPVHLYHLSHFLNQITNYLYFGTFLMHHWWYYGSILERREGGEGGREGKKTIGASFRLAIVHTKTSSSLSPIKTRLSKLYPEGYPSPTTSPIKSPIKATGLYLFEVTSEVTAHAKPWIVPRNFHQVCLALPARADKHQP